MGVKVTNIPGAYAFEGKSYGPFSATNKKGFVEVPAELAASLNLPLHESELDPAQDEIQPEGADIQELLDANHSLKEALDKANAMLDSTHEGNRQLGAVRDTLQTELESTRADFRAYQNDLPGLKARVAELEAGAATEPEGSTPPAEPEGKPATKKASKA